MNLQARCRAWVLASLIVPMSLWAQVITVSAPSSLQNAIQEIGAAFEQARPGSKLRLNIGASGQLLAQLKQGAPVDVYASADSASMDLAQAQGWVSPDTRLDFARNQLVLISPRRVAARFRTLADLEHTGGLRMAVGNPSTVAAGRYAQAALQAHGLWTPLRPSLVYAESVRQALSYVSRGEVAAGLVFHTDALVDAAGVRIDFVVPTALPIVYPAAVVTGSGQAQQAEQFVQFLRGPVAQAVLKRHGFGTL